MVSIYAQYMIGELLSVAISVRLLATGLVVVLKSTLCVLNVEKIMILEVVNVIPIHFIV